jgi:hypothetical protein
MKQKSFQKILVDLICDNKKFDVLPYAWPKIVEEARKEGLLGLLFCNIKQKNLTCFLDKKTKERLEKLYFNQLGQNMLLTEEAQKILKEFKEKDIEVILLKGIRLQSLYAQKGLRPMTDIDFFIKKRDFAKAEDILKSLGFKNTDFYREDFFKNKLVVDLHTDFINAHRINIRSTITPYANNLFFQEAENFNIGNQRILILNTYDEIIYLCTHLFFHHGLRRLIWFFDIKFLIEETPKFNWDRLLKRALFFGLEKPVFICLWLTQLKLNLKLPEGFFEKWSQIKINKIEKRIYNGLLSPEKNEEAFRYLFTFFMMRGLKKKIIFLKELLFPNTNFLKALYSKQQKRHLCICYWQHVRKTIRMTLETLKTIFLNTKKASHLF